MDPTIPQSHSSTQTFTENNSRETTNSPLGNVSNSGAPSAKANVAHDSNMRQCPPNKVRFNLEAINTLHLNDTNDHITSRKSRIISHPHADPSFNKETLSNTNKQLSQQYAKHSPTSKALFIERLNANLNAAENALQPASEPPEDSDQEEDVIDESFDHLLAGSDADLYECDQDLSENQATTISEPITTDEWGNPDYYSEEFGLVITDLEDDNP